MEKIGKISIISAYYALKVGYLELIPKILEKVDINYVRKGDKEFCFEITKECNIEQNQPTIKLLEQYIIAQPEFNEIKLYRRSYYAYNWRNFYFIYKKVIFKNLISLNIFLKPLKSFFDPAAIFVNKT